MKIFSLLFLFVYAISAYSQDITDITSIKSTSTFETVRDSISSLLTTENTLVIRTCEGYREFFLTKENNHWKGYFLKSLKIIGSLGPYIDGEKLFQVDIMTFDADKLYSALQNYKLSSLKQLSREQLMELTKVNKNTYMSLPSASHDCNFTIVCQNNPAVTYTNIIIAEERLQHIPNIKKIHTLYEYLKNEFKAYY